MQAKSKYLSRSLWNVVVAALWMASPSPVAATTKGLNQIVTPDIQPVGVLSVSVQGQNAALGNSEQLQLELGVTKRFEVAVFQGFKPGHFTGGVEYGLLHRKSFLLSTGFLGPWTGDEIQPFLEAGYLHGNDSFTFGAIRQGKHSQPLLGWAHQTTRRLLIEADYQGGGDNFSTLGFTYALNRSLQINPAVYVSNSSGHHSSAYAVLSWSVPLRK